MTGQTTDGVLAVTELNDLADFMRDQCGGRCHPLHNPCAYASAEQALRELAAIKSAAPRRGEATT